MKKRKFIGLSTSSHDASVVIVNAKGDLEYAEATERLLQNKRSWFCFPDDVNFIDKILKKYCHDCEEVVIATTWSEKYLKFLSRFSKIILLNYKKRYFAANLIRGLTLSYIFAGKNLKYRFNQINPGIKIINLSFNHHLTHTANACYTSPFKEAVCFIVDGYGEWGSTKAFLYKDNNIIELKKIKSSKHSLGVFYALLCSACGFDFIKGEEWKVMGLAPYGKYNNDIYNVLSNIIQVKNIQIIQGSNPGKAFKKLFSFKRDENDSPLKSADLAFTGQKFFCDLMSQLLNNLYKEVQVDNLILGGGCALNSAYNGKILDTTPFKRLHVPSAPGDDGNALGAALYAFYKYNPDYKQDHKFITPYLGSRVNSDCIKRIIKFGNLKDMLKPGQSIYKETAKLLAHGKIVGWIQGKAEFGPRALGNRSILADPRNVNIKQEINAKVKFREEFRPFAPSILHEYGNDYFENYQESLYMERALKYKNDVINKIPGVVHVDGTGRLQSVKKELNKEYCMLIKAFFDLTGIPVILNTSFNVMGKPIINSVEDAIAVFFTTGLDVLVIEDQLFIKNFNHGTN